MYLLASFCGFGITLVCSVSVFELSVVLCMLVTCFAIYLTILIVLMTLFDEYSFWLIVVDLVAD